MTVVELRVESSSGFSMPPGCYIGVRIGDVLKQGRYEPQRCYNFEQVDRRKSAKIDIYQHVGSCAVPVDPEASSVYEVAVSSTDPTFAGLRLRVNSQTRREDQEIRAPKSERVSALKNKAKDYLAKHGVEDRLSEAVKALLKCQPDDPTDFLCRHLRHDGQAGPLTTKVEPEVPRHQLQDVATTRPAPIRPFGSYYQAHFKPHEMRKALELFKNAVRPAVAPIPEAAALGEATASSSSREREALRDNSRLRFSEACSSGELREALCALQVVKAGDLLGRASKDGSLLSVIAEVKNGVPDRGCQSATMPLEVHVGQQQHGGNL